MRMGARIAGIPVSYAQVCEHIPGLTQGCYSSTVTSIFAYCVMTVLCNACIVELKQYK